MGLRRRFGIPSDGPATFGKDYCLWLFCMPFVGVQEYQQVMSLLRHHRRNCAGAQESVNLMPAAELVGQPVAVELSGAGK